MTERNYDIPPFLLALVSLALSSFLLFFPLFAKPASFAQASSSPVLYYLHYIWGVPIMLGMWGWIPLLVIAIVSSKRTSRIKRKYLKLLTDKISLCAIVISAACVLWPLLLFLGWFLKIQD
jgi:hypothetical protein